MPYVIVEREGKYCVCKEDDMEPIHCHDSEAAAKEHLAALYSSEGQDGEEEKQKGQTGLLVKAVNEDERVIEGFAATWDMDDEGEAFDKQAFSSSLARYMKRPVLLWSHGSHEDIGMNPIGRILDAKITDAGLWVRAQLYKADRYADMAWNLIKQGVQHFSVGAPKANVRKMGSRIMEWPLVEVSVAPFAANPMARFQIVKEMMASYAKAIGIELEDLGLEAHSKEAAGEVLPGANISNGEHKNMEENMNELVGKAVAEALAAKEKEAADKAAAKKAFDDEVAKRVAEELAKKQVTRKIGFSTEEGPIEVAGAYDHVAPAQMALGHMVLKSAGIQPSTAYTRTLVDLASKHFKNGALRVKEYGLDPKHSLAQKGMGSTITFGTKHDAWLERELAKKADELMGSDVSTYGDEWIPVYYSRELIPLIRNQARVLGLFRQLEVQGESLVIPIQTGSLTWYKTAQTDDSAESAYDNAFVTNRISKASTSNITLTPKKLSALAMWTGELDEQSLVPMLPFLQQEMSVSGAEVLDELLISGDTDTTSANISDYGNGSISTAWHLLLFNGLRDHALGGSNARSASTLTVDDFLATKKLMGTNGAYALDPAKLVWIIDPGIYWKLQSLGEALTLDKFGPGFTFQSGVLERVFGSPVIVSDKYGATDSSGYINNSGGSNTLGSFLCVRPDQAVVGFGRRMKVETQRIARTDSYEIVAHMMLDFDMATAEAVGYSYNATVA